ncbi:MAG: dihydrofolate reductase [Haliscomenobacteraceae bacterium CHB4]|nr:dihydrofolate reductase [Haliscomenobacteraceae bacterium CHB4]
MRFFPFQILINHPFIAMKRYLFLPACSIGAVLFLLLYSCSVKTADRPTGTAVKSTPVKPPATVSSNPAAPEKVILDTFADLQILQYELPGWDKLSLRQKTFIYYLSEAALAGRDIIYDQHCKHNLAIRKTLEGIYNSYKGDRASADWKSFATYTKRVWFSNGIHHHYNETKILPGFSREYFIALVQNSDKNKLPLQAGEEVNDLITRLYPIMFDPNVLGKRTSKDKGTDVVKASAVNFYEGVSADQVNAWYQEKLKAAGANPPQFGLNSKLTGTKMGNLTEVVWKAGEGNMYGPAISKIVENLEKSIPFAENEQQKKAIRLLVEYYKTGDLKKFDEYNIAWVKDTESTIDFINGFIEVYHDPLGYKADFEAVVQYNDPDATAKMATVSQHAQYFEDNSTIPAAYKKKNVKGVSYRVINVAMEGGDCAPSTPIGINLPNSNWIREQYGSKSVSLNNIENAYGKAGGALATQEFAHDAEEIENAKKYAEVCGKMHTALHEVIGHASGQLKPGMPEPNVTLQQYASTLEEGRADLVALYFMPDPKLVEWGLMPDANAYKAEYDQYIRNGLLMQLRRIPAGADIEEDHMRNRQLVAAWAYEKGKKDNVIARVERNGKTYYDIRDYAGLRVLFGQLLAEIQRIKSEGDYQAAHDLVETYGVKTDVATGKQVKARYANLPTKAYSGFVQPKLVAVKDASGKITDVKVERELDFVQQMLRYGKEYSFLPVNN